MGKKEQYSSKQGRRSVTVSVLLAPQVVYIYTWAVITDKFNPLTEPATDIHLHHNEDRYCTTCLSGRRLLAHCTAHGR